MIKRKKGKYVCTECGYSWDSFSYTDAPEDCSCASLKKLQKEESDKARFIASMLNDFETIM